MFLCYIDFYLNIYNKYLHKIKAERFLFVQILFNFVVSKTAVVLSSMKDIKLKAGS